MSDYWLARAKANEERANRLATSYAIRHAQMYKTAYREIDNYLNSLYTELLSLGDKVAFTRTELWRYSKYKALEKAIEENILKIGQHQITLLEEATDKVFIETLETTFAQLKKADIDYNLITFAKEKYALDSAWSGKTFSNRVWANTSKLTTKLKKEITDILVLGKSPEYAKQAIMKNLNVGYNTADRLIRTEVSYAYNSASIESYKFAGVDLIECVVSEDERTCPICGEFADKQFIIGTQPLLPSHPRCRCCYAPVIEL